MTISGNPPSFQYDEPRSMNPEAIKAVREALEPLADRALEEARFKDHTMVAVKLGHLRQCQRVLALLATEQAKAPPDRERLAVEAARRIAATYYDVAEPSNSVGGRLRAIAEVEIAAALRLSPVTAGEWQDISTAPKDGKRILIAGNNRGAEWVQIGHFAPYAGNSWQADYPGALQGPHHWMPLTPSPKEAGR